MAFLLRFVIISFIIWLICKSIYSLGQKNAFQNGKRNSKVSSHRKKVDSTVVEKEKNE
jgi:large-conductance mechanosensitive channel